MKTDKHEAIFFSSPAEEDVQKALLDHLKNTPVPDDELLGNLGIFLTSKNLSRILFFAEIYKKILFTHGVVIEFGPRWGQTLSLLSALRGIFEPFNRHRKIVGFDTFEGHKGIGKEDGDGCRSADGEYSVTNGYEDYLSRILEMQEKLNPISHIKKFELVKGDAAKTVPEYFKQHPETVVSLAVFDFDIYKPTKAALETIKPYLCKGSILVFDELCDGLFPGETVALREVFGLPHVRLKRMPMTSRVSYLEIE